MDFRKEKMKSLDRYKYLKVDRLDWESNTDNPGQNRIRFSNVCRKMLELLHGSVELYRAAVSWGRQH